MAWMNEWDVEDALRYFGDDTPNLRTGAIVLGHLVMWTNDNSDGWPYWHKPSRASQRLQDLLSGAMNDYRRGNAVPDISDRTLRSALTPIKAFLTRQGVPHDQILVR
jgi:hypothetical protein